MAKKILSDKELIQKLQGRVACLEYHAQKHEQELGRVCEKWRKLLNTSENENATLKKRLSELKKRLSEIQKALLTASFFAN